MTTETAERDLIAEQNHLAYLKKKVRELQDSLKYHTKELADLTSGKRSHWGAGDVEHSTNYHTQKKAEFEKLVEAAQAKVTEAEALRPILVPFAHVLKWFQGSNLDNARFALELIGESQKKGSWIPGASRRCRAALSEAKAAKKGLVKAQFTRDLKPILDLMEKWDSTRPVPVFTTVGASRTVTATLKEFKAERVAVCNIRWEERSRIDPLTKKTIYYSVGILLWPEGTLHGESKFKGTKDNAQCEACGHAIKNTFNWVPLVIWGTDGKPRSLWVGRDCAWTLFGIKMTGDLELKEE